MSSHMKGYTTLRKRQEPGMGISVNLFDLIVQHVGFECALQIL